MSTGAPLRVGLLVNSLLLPAWVRRIIEDIQASGHARIVLVVRKRRTAAAPSRWRRLWRHRGELVYMAYRRFDDLLFRISPDAFVEADASPLLTSCETLDVAVRETKHSDHFTPEDVEAIRSRDLDVLLRFGFRILRGPILEAARYGIWSYHHGDNRTCRGGPAGFWEVMLGLPTTGSMLQVLTEDLDNGKVIYRSLAKTDRTSVKRNRNAYYWKSSQFVLRKLTELAHEGPQTLDLPDETGLGAYSARLWTKPRNGEAMKVLARFGARVVADRISRAGHESQWGIAYRLGANLGRPDTTLFRFCELSPPGGRSWADPFPVTVNGAHFVFVEDYDHAQSKGHIGVIRIDEQGKHGPPVAVLKQPHHLSYPFVFQWRGSWFMIPESGQANRIEAFRATRFPFEWEPEAVLMDDVRAADSTVIAVDDRWWMFSTIARHPGVPNLDELYLFSSDSPLGPWEPHRRNPVKSDATSSRSAGALFWHRGQLFRPSQDCSGRYGSAVVINRVDRLDADSYQETPVDRLVPSWRAGLTGIHTLNSSGRLTVVDFRHARRRVLAAL